MSIEQKIDELIAESNLIAEEGANEMREGLNSVNLPSFKKTPISHATTHSDSHEHTGDAANRAEIAYHKSGYYMHKAAHQKKDSENDAALESNSKAPHKHEDFVKHQKQAVEHAAAYHKLTGKKLRDTNHTSGGEFTKDSHESFHRTMAATGSGLSNHVHVPNLDESISVDLDSIKLADENLMQEDIDALLTGEELSEEFKEKTATVFEAAVLNRVKLETAKLEEKYEASVEARVDEEVKGLVEDINGFLSLMAEQWKKDNEVALEQSIKTEITETFINGLKNLFTESYIDIPEDKFDVVADLQEQLDKVASQLKEATDTNVELLKTINESKRTELINKLTEGLTDVDVEKFQSLAEEIKFDDAHTFEKKLTAIRESYFKVPATAKPIVESVVTDAIIEEEVKPKGKYVDPTVAMIAESINSKKKGSK